MHTIQQSSNVTRSYDLLNHMILLLGTLVLIVTSLYSVITSSRQHLSLLCGKRIYYFCLLRITMESIYTVINGTNVLSEKLHKSRTHNFSIRDFPFSKGSRQAR